jgi:hypothetical protein
MAVLIFVLLSCQYHCVSGWSLVSTTCGSWWVPFENCSGAGSFLYLVFQEGSRNGPTIKLRGYIVKVAERNVFDPVFSAVCCQPILCKDQVGTFHCIPVGQTVADKQRWGICSVEQAHHGWFAGRAAMRTGLMKKRKLCTPHLATSFKHAGANARLLQQGVR